VFCILTSPSSIVSDTTAEINALKRKPIKIAIGRQLAAAVLVFASASAAFANSAGKYNACTGIGVHNATIQHEADGTVQIARHPWPAPVGHHQPRASDVGADALPSAERDRWLDTELDRKLVICHGC
jgi:hypothetical protein